MAATSCTRARVSSETYPAPVSARLAVDFDTPAARATSAMPAMGPPRQSGGSTCIGEVCGTGSVDIVPCPRSMRHRRPGIYRVVINDDCAGHRESPSVNMESVPDCSCG
nr:hypothetical protein GCM10025699_01070 [Microbacterium flavescens]